MVFKVGDIVTVKEGVNYKITTNQSRLKILKILEEKNYGDPRVEVEVIDHKQKKFQKRIGCTYKVYVEDLKLLSRFRIEK